MKIIETQFTNSAITFGNKLIPYIKNGANILEGAMNYLSAHPGVMSGIGSLAGIAFAGALATKVVGVGAKIAEAFGATVEGGIATTIGVDISSSLAASWAIQKLVTDPVRSSFTKMEQYFADLTSGFQGGGNGGGGNGGGGNGGTNANGSTPAPSKVMTKEVSTVYGGYFEQNFITAAQFAALEAYFGGAAKVKTLETNSSAAFYNAVRNFEGQDQNKNYSVTINVKA